MVLGALDTSLPYVYFQLMTWVVAGAAVMTALQAYKHNMQTVAWVFAFVAVVFNPVAPLYLRSDIWQLVDIAAATLFVLSLLVLRPKRS